MGMFPRQEESHLAIFFHTLIRERISGTGVS